MNSSLRFVLIAAAIGLGLYFFVFKGSDRRPPPPLNEPAPLSATARGGEERLVWMRSGALTAAVSTYSGTFRKLYLNNRQFGGQEISTTSEENALAQRPTVVFERDGRNVMPPHLTFQVESESPSRLELVARPEGTDVEVRRTIRAHTEYAFRVHTAVVNHGAPGRLRYSQGLAQWVRRGEESGRFFQQSWRLPEALCLHDGGRLYREGREKVAEHGASDGISRNSEFVGVGNLYFLHAIVPQGGERAACHLRVEDRPNSDEATGSLIYARLSYAPVELAQGASHVYPVIAYHGPKLGSALRAAAPVLGEAVNLGFFAIIARGLLKLLQLLYLFARNWGLAIILLTVIVRLALFPLLARSTKSLAMMQKLKPELDAINEKFKDNQEQKGLATMELYRKHKINPLSGCLPQLAQLPIWWALYTTLQTSVELFHSPFFGWVKDLSAPDPFFILPLVLGVVMFLQQKLMPPAMPDPMQAKMMLYFMPIFLTGISLFLPAGLALYMLVNSVLAIIQQKITKAQIDRMVLAQDPGSAISVRPIAEPAIEPGASGRSSDNGAGNRGGSGRGKRR